MGERVLFKLSNDIALTRVQSEYHQCTAMFKPSPHEGEVCLLDEKLLEVVHHLGVHYYSIHGWSQVPILIVL